MSNTRIIEDLSIKINEIVDKLPAAEWKHNLGALIKGALTKMELVSREEFDIQTEVLRKTREKLQVLEKRLAELEEPPTHK